MKRSFVDYSGADLGLTLLVGSFVIGATGAVIDSVFGTSNAVVLFLVLPLAVWALAMGIAAFVMPFLVTAIVVDATVTAVKTKSKAKPVLLAPSTPYVRKVCNGCGAGQYAAPLYCRGGYHHDYTQEPG